MSSHARRWGFALAALAGASAAAPARAESPTKETIQGLKELTEPASHAEMRFNLGGLVSAASSRVELRLDVAPRPDFWYGVGVSSVTATTTTISTTASSRGELVTKTEETESITLSARVFKRVGPLVMSAGLVDNRGGGGLELRGPGDRLRLEALLSEWKPTDARKLPTLRVGASAQWGAFYVQGGALDVVDRKLSALYAGAGLRWTDVDLAQAIWWLRR